MRPRLRCCGRFCYWALPFGPYTCGECGAAFAGTDVPRAHQARFLEAAAELLGGPPQTPAALELCREIWRQTGPRGHVLVLPRAQ